MSDMKASSAVRRRSVSKKIIFFGWYTLFFALCAFLAFYYFREHGRSFIWASSGGNMDGISQHYTALSYYGSYLRSIARTFVTTGKLSVPLYDASIGLGNDVLTTLHYYVIGDPLTLLSAVVPRENTEVLYNILVIFRLYLAGLSFSLFAAHFKKDHRFYIMIGALVYVFTAYSLAASVRHPYFTNPMIYLPLLLLGAEYIFEKRRPYLFIIMVALCGWSNFYFFFMLCVLTALYVLLRCPDYLRGQKLSAFFKTIGRFAGFAVIGVLLSGVVLLPMIVTMLGTTRTDLAVKLPGLYNLSFYEKYLYAHVSSSGIGTWTYLGHGAVAIIAVIVLWIKKKHGCLKRCFIACSALMLFPVFGWLINGMSYPSNRWCWGYSLCLAMITTLCLENLALLTRKGWTLLAGVGLLYCGGAFYYAPGSESYRWGLMVFALTLGALFLFSEFVARKRYYRAVIKCTVLASVVLSVLAMGSGKNKYYSKEFINQGMALSYHTQNPGAQLRNVNDDSFYRYEIYAPNVWARPYNASLINEGHPTDSYFSLTNAAYNEMIRSLGHKEILHRMTDLDQRTILGTLLNVKYTALTQEKGKPYGYAEQPLFTERKDNPALATYDQKDPKLEEQDQDHKYSYYQNEIALPFGYTYGSYITRETYDSLSFAQRQQAMLESAVLEEDSDVVPNGTESLSLENVTKPKIVLECSNGIRREGNKFVTFIKETYVDIYLTDAKANAETYINIANVGFREMDPVEKAKRSGEWKELSEERQNELIHDQKYFSQGDGTSLEISMLNMGKNVRLYTENYSYYRGNCDYSVNLGYHTETPEKIRVCFRGIGEYTLDGFEVEQIGFDEYGKQVEALSDEAMENVIFSDNTVTGDITVSSAKLLCLSLPYSSGWRAYVDGVETTVLKTDVGLSGLALTAGHHTIELRYFTPGLKVGLISTAAGAVSLLGVMVFYIYKRKKKRGWEQEKNEEMDH